MTLPKTIGQKSTAKINLTSLIGWAELVTAK